MPYRRHVKEMDCRYCYASCQVGDDCEKVTCSRCVQRLVKTPEELAKMPRLQPSTKRTRRPRI
jgi:hypothetical protein